MLRQPGNLELFEESIGNNKHTMNLSSAKGQVLMLGKARAEAV